MNNYRRKELNALLSTIEEVKDALEALKEEEEEYRDNMPENLWGSERYDKAEAAVSSLEEAISSLEDAISGIEVAQG